MCDSGNLEFQNVIDKCYSLLRVVAGRVFRTGLKKKRYFLKKSIKQRILCQKHLHSFSFFFLVCSVSGREMQVWHIFQPPFGFLTFHTSFLSLRNIFPIQLS